MKKCEICGKELDHKEDWFMVKKQLWQYYCRLMNIDTRAVVCTDCFERVLGEIRPEHLNIHDGRVAPMNFWILKKYKSKDFIPLIQKQKEYIQAQIDKGIRFSGINQNKLVKECEELIKELS